MNGCTVVTAGTVARSTGASGGGHDYHAGLDHLTPGEKKADRVDRLAARALPALHILADTRDRIAQASLDAAQRDAKALRDLAVGQVAEVGELEQLLLARRQVADRLVDGLPHHR